MSVLYVKVHDSTNEEMTEQGQFVQTIDRRKPFLSKKIMEAQLKFTKHVWRNVKHTRIMTYEQMRLKLELSGHFIDKVKHGGGGMMISSYGTWTPGSHQVNHDLPCKPEYSGGKCETICLTAKALLKLGHAAQQ